MKKWLLFFITILMLTSLSTTWAAENINQPKGKILFIPHDNRPISKAETAEVVEKLGYEVVTPPDAILSNGNNRYGDTTKLWSWTEQNLPGTDALVISTDTMIYGGLVPSRNHNLQPAELALRIAKFKDLRAKNPKLKIYGFGSLMRTPRSGAYAGAEEPAYYRQYGEAIFNTCALLDKKEMQGLNASDEAKLNAYQTSVPADDWKDWLGRRDKNIAVSKNLIDFTKNGVFSYFVIGKDDNAPLSQTHREGRYLAEYAKDIPATKFQLLAGIDEFGMLLLSRAVNDLEQQIPFVYVKYAAGKGAATVPSYSDTKISDTIRSSILVAGGMQVNNPAKADLYLLVNTNNDGRTGEANNVSKVKGQIANDGSLRKNTKSFVQMVNNAVASGYPVGIADIAFGNGADNALMTQLRDNGLLYKIRAYAGWNTPTNSTGFVIGTGLLANRLDDAACDSLLTRRYLEDWGYQANVRTAVGDSIYKFRDSSVYSNLGRNEAGVLNLINIKIKQFAEKNLPPFSELINLKAYLPWHRMFEAGFDY